MSLRTDSLELLKTLKQTIKALELYEQPGGGTYASDIADRLLPAVADFERAVLVDKSKDSAVRALDEIAPLMNNVNGAATKGGLDFFPGYDDKTLDDYWRLNTIFRETRYSHESL